MMVLWKYFKRWTTWSKRVLANKIPSSTVEQINQEVQQKDCHSQYVSSEASIRCIVIFLYLKSIYLISYTRLFTKLNLFEILIYSTFITMKISRYMVISHTLHKTVVILLNLTYPVGLILVLLHTQWSKPRHLLCLSRETLATVHNLGLS